MADEEMGFANYLHVKPINPPKTYSKDIYEHAADLEAEIAWLKQLVSFLTGMVDRVANPPIWYVPGQTAPPQPLIDPNKPMQKG